VKAWNYRHPNVLLAWWVFVWIAYALSCLGSLHEGDWFWTIVFFVAVLYADSRCRYWYDRTGEQ
jgi:hypothetical protein